MIFKFYNFMCICFHQIKSIYWNHKLLCFDRIILDLFLSIVLICDCEKKKKKKKKN
mgnify:CR=1 FL=1